MTCRSDGPETEAEQRLSKDKLYDLCRVKAVCRFVSQSDLAFYQALVEVLIPDVLRPIPSMYTPVDNCAYKHFTAMYNCLLLRHVFDDVLFNCRYVDSSHSQLCQGVGGLAEVCYSGGA